MLMCLQNLCVLNARPSLMAIKELLPYTIVCISADAGTDMKHGFVTFQEYSKLS